MEKIHELGEACLGNTNTTSLEQAISELRKEIHFDFSELLNNKESEYLQYYKSEFQLLGYDMENAWINDTPESMEELFRKYGELKALQIARSLNLTDLDTSILFQYIESSSFQCQCERLKKGLEFYENLFGNLRGRSIEMPELEYLQAS